jgi:hydroxymethylbilane synthase
MRLTIGSRRSDLARIKRTLLVRLFAPKHPQIEIDYSFHESLGDKNLNDPLWKMPEKGVFTQDFREGLLRGDFDLVVHSWKDLAIEIDPETEIVATLPRADARDLLLVREDRWAEVEASGVMTILTSSPRRAHNLESFLRQALPGKIDRIEFRERARQRPHAGAETFADRCRRFDRGQGRTRPFVVSAGGGRG